MQRTEPWHGGGGGGPPFLLFNPCPKAFGCTEHPRPAYPQGREENEPIFFGEGAQGHFSTYIFCPFCKDKK